MKRDIDRLIRGGPYDLLIIGGGIYGACIARDAALRGLAVALLEKEDFGHATSANSLKIIHGGLRYLQDGSPRLLRLLARERQTWLRVAPHLVRPLPCLIPTTRGLSRRRAVMFMASKLNDLLTYDRNRGMHPAQRIPAGSILDRRAISRLLPRVTSGDVTGGLLWYDAQVLNTERLLLAVISSAAANGARVANYVEVTGFLRDAGGVNGVTATDVLGQQRFAIEAQLVIVAAGAWNGALLEMLDVPVASSLTTPSLAINLVTRQLRHDYAIALPVALAESLYADAPVPRTLFIVPWQQYSLIGTMHLPWQRQGFDRPHISPEIISGFLKAVNRLYPDAKLAIEDVKQVHHGFLPAYKGSGAPRLLRRSSIIDHERVDGVAGLISVEGVKYTTARHTAQLVVDRALRKLQRQSRPCVTHLVPVTGGETGDIDAFTQNAKQAVPPEVSSTTLSHLITNHGDGYRKILLETASGQPLTDLISNDPPVLAAEVVHAVREEMAVRLADVVQRRTALGAAGPPDRDTISCCADIMARELDWTPEQKEDEIRRLDASYGQHAPMIQGLERVP